MAKAEERAGGLALERDKADRHLQEERLRYEATIHALNQELSTERNRITKAEEAFKAQRERLAETLGHWLEGELASLGALRTLEAAGRDPAAGTEVRALLLQLIAGAGMGGVLSLSLRPLSDNNVANADDPARRHRSANAEGPVSVIRYGMSAGGRSGETPQ